MTNRSLFRLSHLHNRNTDDQSRPSYLPTSYSTTYRPPTLLPTDLLPSYLLTSYFIPTYLPTSIHTHLPTCQQSSRTKVTPKSPPSLFNESDHVKNFTISCLANQNRARLPRPRAWKVLDQPQSRKQPIRTTLDFPCRAWEINSQSKRKKSVRNVILLKSSYQVYTAKSSLHLQICLYVYQMNTSIKSM